MSQRTTDVLPSGAGIPDNEEKSYACTIAWSGVTGNYGIWGV